jgi:two-component sensor histidine kinase
MSNFFPKVATADFLFPPFTSPHLRRCAFALPVLCAPFILGAQDPHPVAITTDITLTLLGFIAGISLTLVAMYFFIKRLWASLKKHQLYERQLYAEKETIAREKEIQQRFYANFIHEVIKGEAQCLLVESTAGDNLRDHLAEFVKTCELGQSFVDQSTNNLYDLMKTMEFFYANRLHSEMEERSFYCDIDPALQSVELDDQQKYELIFFLRECMNNIRKYASYKHTGLKIHREKGAGKAILLEIKDDGLGFQHSLGMDEKSVEINEQNLLQFYKNHLQHRRCTGIREIFRKAARLKGKLTIRSASGEGTSILLRFHPTAALAVV